MTLEFQNQISIQPTESGGGGGGSTTITVPNLTFPDETASLYPTFINGKLKCIDYRGCGWLPENPTGTITSFHAHIEFTTPSSFSSGYMALLGQADSTNYVTLQVDIVNSTIAFIVSEDGLSWKGWLEAPITQNKNYIIDCYLQDGTISATLTEVNGETVELSVKSGYSSSVSNINWTNNMAVGTDNDGDLFYGEIDMTKTFVECNDNYIWNGTTKQTISQSQMALGFMASGGVQ